MELTEILSLVSRFLSYAQYMPGRCSKDALDMPNKISQICRRNVLDISKTSFIHTQYMVGKWWKYP